jgi:hypothetical protein
MLEERTVKTLSALAAKAEEKLILACAAERNRKAA